MGEASPLTVADYHCQSNQESYSTFREKSRNHQQNSKSLLYLVCKERTKCVIQFLGKLRKPHSSYLNQLIFFRNNDMYIICFSIHLNLSTLISQLSMQM